jgi:hypothetical protein
MTLLTALVLPRISMPDPAAPWHASPSGVATEMVPHRRTITLLTALANPDLAMPFLVTLRNAVWCYHRNDFFSKAIPLLTARAEPVRALPSPPLLGNPRH